MIDLEQTKAALISKREELEQRLRKIIKDKRHKDRPLDPDFAEQAVERENEEVLDALESEAQYELQQIEHAFARIEHNEYGICIDCGEEIPEKRLNALPYSVRCIECAKRQTQT